MKQYLDGIELSYHRFPRNREIENSVTGIADKSNGLTTGRDKTSRFPKLWMGWRRRCHQRRITPG